MLVQTETGQQLTMPSLEINKIEPSNSLILKVGSKHFSFVTVNSSGEIIDNYDITFHNPIAETEIAKELETKLKFFLNDFRSVNKVKLIVDNNLSTLVPESLFDKKLCLEYLKYSVRLVKNDSASFDNIDEIEAVNVYLPYTNVNNYLFDNFGSFDYYHYSTLFIKKCIKSSHKIKNSTNLNFRGDCFDIVIFKNKKLMFHNSFNYKTKEDVLYFILSSFLQNKLKFEKTYLFVSGEIDENDDVFVFLKSFHRKISISKQINSITDKNKIIDSVILCA